MTTKRILFSVFLLGTISNGELKTFFKSFHSKKIDQELFTAVKDNCVWRVRSILVDGANPNAKDKDGNTPLHLLPRGSNKIVNSGGADANIAQLLLQFGANPNTQNNTGDTPAHICACNYEVLRLLDARDADFAIKNKKGETPFELTDEYKENPNCPGRSLLEEYQRLRNEVLNCGQKTLSNKKFKDGLEDINHQWDRCKKRSLDYYIMIESLNKKTYSQ